MEARINKEIISLHLKKSYLIYLFFLVVATIIAYTQIYSKPKFQGQILIQRAVGIDSIEANVSNILFDYMDFLFLV